LDATTHVVLAIRDNSKAGAGRLRSNRPALLTFYAFFGSCSVAIVIMSVAVPAIASSSRRHGRRNASRAGHCACYGSRSSMRHSGYVVPTEVTDLGKRSERPRANYPADHGRAVGQEGRVSRRGGSEVREPSTLGTRPRLACFFVTINLQCSAIACVNSART